MNYDVADFQRDVIEKSKTIPVLVDFWAEWCGPCKVLGPVLERLAEKSDGRWVLAKVDTDKFQEVAVKYGIRSIPNVKLFVDGEVNDEFTGALPEPAVARWLGKALPDPNAKALAEAEAALAAGATDRGRDMLEAILARDPGNERARVQLAGTVLFTDSFRALLLVEGIEENSDQFPMADSVRMIGTLLSRLKDPGQLPEDEVKPLYIEAIGQLAAADLDGALEKFIEVIRRNRSYDDEGARKACVAIFRILGDEHEIARRRRREFSSALYA